MIRFKSFSVLLSAVFILTLACKVYASKVERYPNLSEVIEKKMSGKYLDSDQSKGQIELYYQEWIKFRGCPSYCEDASKKEQNPFCALSAVRKNSEKKTKRTASFLVHALKTAHLDKLKEVSDSDLSYAIKRVQRFHDLDLLVKKVLEAKTCVSGALLFGLGLKAESEFPKPDFRALAVSLYTKALDCGFDSAGVQASYRLGLLHIWDDRCDLAEQVLGKIPADLGAGVTDEYRLRTAYWRYVCAVKTKSQPLQAKLKDWITQEYPLSLHALKVRQESPGMHFPPTKETDPPVYFRSARAPYLSWITQAVEVLLDHKESHFASLLLEKNLQTALKTEPSFQLYWSVLFKRTGNERGSFQLLANIFRQDPLLVSNKTLQLMYPLHRWDLINHVNSALDPFLLISLMRQESAFEDRAKSSAGAVGLMQIQLSTARLFKRVSQKSLFDPRDNIQIGSKYLDYLIRHNDGEVELALASYNAGPMRLKQWRKRYPIEDRLLFLDFIPIRETREYVAAIARNYYWYSKLYPTPDRRISSPAPFRILGF